MRIHVPRTLTIEGAAKLVKAFADPVRLRLLNLLSGDEVCVCHLHEALNLPQPTVSRHLAYLRKAGLVVGRKEGLWVYYRLSKPATPLQEALLESVVPRLRDDPAMRADRVRLEELRCC
jgi:ArsR family transcriptional regulator